MKIYNRRGHSTLYYRLRPGDEFRREGRADTMGRRRLQNYSALVQLIRIFSWYIRESSSSSARRRVFDRLAQRHVLNFFTAPGTPLQNRVH